MVMPPSKNVGGRMGMNIGSGGHDKGLLDNDFEEDGDIETAQKVPRRRNKVRGN